MSTFGRCVYRIKYLHHKNSVFSGIAALCLAVYRVGKVLYFSGKCGSKAKSAVLTGKGNGLMNAVCHALTGDSFHAERGNALSQNIGLLAMTKVVNRYAIATGAGIMILAGIFPVVGAVLATLPEAVLGGCTIMMFGNIVISGLMMIGSCGYSQRNIVIAALSLSVGLGFTQAPQMFAIFPDIVRTVFAENCVAVVFIAAIVMNLIMPKEGEVKARMPLK